ncbi:uncharacterized protein LOC114803226 isoform X2 [Denticeps clupeoides]|uniref:uncharacterized protein LOC114803226 isoform X2 n=1 Tax=Denticeps clupeoides TaxID=299321 RepID=UPI0010A4BC7A|nr:uncharacterized protein LOC114803226 isoform X2 [Denticeps clupeoides]
MAQVWISPKAANSESAAMWVSLIPQQLFVTVPSASDAEVVLLFGHAEPDDELRGIPDTTTVVLVVMLQHMGDEPSIIHLKFRNLFIIHCLYINGEGIQDPSKIQEAFMMISNHVKETRCPSESRHPSSTASSKQDLRSVQIYQPSAAPKTHQWSKGKTDVLTRFTQLVQPRTPTPPQTEKTHRVVKFNTMVIGKTLGSHEQLKTTVVARDSRLREVKSPEESDVTLAFYVVVFSIEKEIDRALHSIKCTKPAILVLMHHTFDPMYPVFGRRANVEHENVCIVDCLFFEDKGLLECEKNEETLRKVLEHLKNLFGAFNRDSVKDQDAGACRDSSKFSRRSENTVSRFLHSQGNLFSVKSSCQGHGTVPAYNASTQKTKGINPPQTDFEELKVKFFPVVIGHALNVDKEFLNHITAKHKTLREVGSAEQSSVILAFCPIVSRLGTDIEEALRHLKYEKPVVLVVMHHTSDPEYVVPSSSVYVKDRNIFTVDCLFFDDKGMLNCQRNYEAYDKVVQKLKSYR